MNNDFFNEFCNLINILSFAIQLENNDELHKQSTNDDVINNLHEDILNLLEDNRVLFSIVIKQNENILALLRGDKDE